MEDKKHLIYKEDLLDLFTVQAPSMSYNKMFMAVANSPTVDAVEVVHGRWEFSHTTTVEKYDVVKCSNCGHEAFAIAIYVKEGHYCPNCGARMDLEVE